MSHPPDELLTAFPFSLKTYSQIPCTVPDLKLYVVHVTAHRTGDPDGLYLLQVYETENPELVLENQRRLVDRPHAPFVSLLPRSEAVAQIPGFVGLLCEVKGITHAVPVQPWLRDPAADTTSLKQMIKWVVSALQSWNPSTDLFRDERTWDSGFVWLNAYARFAGTGTSIPQMLMMNRKTYRNPLYFAAQESLWSAAFPILALRGLAHGRFDVSRIYEAENPFLIDVRGCQQDAPILLDWATLELSLLSGFMPNQSEPDWNEWVGLCEVIHTDLLPAQPPKGRNAAIASDLLMPMRNALQAYLATAPDSLREMVGISFWMSATIAGLRLSADSEASPFTQKAGLAYATCAFDRVGRALNLPQASQTVASLDFKAPPVQVRVPVPHAAHSPTVFKSGYALVIGVDQQSDERVARSLPPAADDAGDIAAFLCEGARYVPDQVRVLTGKNASGDQIKAGFEWLRDCIHQDRESTVMVYYSGHGGLVDGHYYLIPHDTTWESFYQTALPISTFEGWLTNLETQRLVVLLDCCHAGSAQIKGMGDDLPFHAKAPDPAALNVGEGRVLIASSTGTQKSLILGGHRNSLFTEVLLEALSAPGEVEALDVFKTLRDEVPRRAAAAGREQNPRFSAKGYDRIILRR